MILVCTIILAISLCTGTILVFNEKQLKESKKELREQNEHIACLREKLSGKTTTITNLEEKLANQEKAHTELQKQFTTQFENLANKIFDEKTSKFIIQNKESIDLLLKPISEKITDFKKKVEDVYVNESNQRAELKGEILRLFDLNQKISKEAQELTLALKGESKTQGIWGELILSRILEISGLEEGREFKAQASFSLGDGKKQQPDVILLLPDNKHMIIDAKVSLTAYEKYISEIDEDKKTRYLKDHVNSVKSHITELSKKNYQNLYNINTPEFVLMFMPIDPAFGLALQTDPELYNSSFEQGIILVSPLSLLATLRTISSIWKKDYQNKNVIEIARQGGALYDKFVAFLEDMQNIGKQLSSTQRSYENALNKLSTGTGNLINKTESLRKLGAKVSKTIPSDLIS